jgi:hypothetical protein
MFCGLRRAYVLSAVLALNCFLFLLLLNLASAVILNVRERAAQGVNPVEEKYGDLSEVYPGMSRAELNDLLNETYSRPLLFEPFTQFTERPHKGKYVNVDVNGFRISRNQGPWPPDRKQHAIVFLFGGSTTFGYGLPDWQTIASSLQDLLASCETGKCGTDVRRETPSWVRRFDGRQIRVYNFGRGHYYSTQERILLENLLLDGFIPDAVIFLDGLNDFSHAVDPPTFSEELGRCMDRGFSWETVRALFRELPMVKVAGKLQNRLRRMLSPVVPSAAGEINEAHYNDPPLLKKTVQRYLENKRMVESLAREYGFNAVFVWQPSPAYKYDLSYHQFAEKGFGNFTYTTYGYLMMAQLFNSHSIKGHFIWCADIQEKVYKPLYVDMVHYNAELSTFVSDCIVEGLERSIHSPVVEYD